MRSREILRKGGVLAGLTSVVVAGSGCGDSQVPIVPTSTPTSRTVQIQEVGKILDVPPGEVLMVSGHQTACTAENPDGLLVDGVDNYVILDNRTST